MSNLIRTTITLPKDIYSLAKINSAYSKTSLSQYISTTLAKYLKINPQKSVPSLKSIAGSLKLGADKVIHRQDIYEDRLRSKMGY
jgi:hypothetical protein